MQSKVALIVGITSQDGAFLAEFLMRKGYDVHGTGERAMPASTPCMKSQYESPDMDASHFVVHDADLSNANDVNRLVQKLQPDELYNLTAQHPLTWPGEVAGIAGTAERTIANNLATLRLLESIRVSGLAAKTRFYQAGVNALNDMGADAKKEDDGAFDLSGSASIPALTAQQITVNYRRSYGMYACNGVLFNGESLVIGESAITRKITRSVARVSLGLQACVRVADLNVLRDWGHARDYVAMQWLMLQQAEADDFLIATGRRHSVRDFVHAAFATLGIEIEFSGSLLGETARVVSVADDEVTCKVGDVVVRLDPQCARPEVSGALRPQLAKDAQKLLGAPTSTLAEFVGEMIAPERVVAKRDLRSKDAGAQLNAFHD